MKRFILDQLREIRKKHQRDGALIKGLGEHNIHQPIGRCLFSYTTDFIGFVNNHPEIGPRGWDPITLPHKLDIFSQSFSGHTMHWESAELVRLLIKKGFIVDCIYDRKGYLLEDVSGYDLIIDEWDNLPRWCSQNPTAKKLFYATGSHWIYHNKAELIRHEWLFHRRNVVVPTFRQIPPILGPEYADLVSCFGNQTVQSTYGHYQTKVRKLWISTTAFSQKSIENKNFVQVKNRFLYFGSSGWVHRGLDLVIEAFLKEPNYELFICGLDASRDSAFWKVYGREIESASNIHVLGRLDPLGDDFRKITDSTIAVIYPSASEGCSGAVVQCMHFGLIPLVTKICGLEIHDEWPSLAGISDVEMIQNIRDRCHEIVEMEEEKLLYWALFSRTYACSYHTRESYSNSASALLDELLVKNSMGLCSH